MRKLVMWATAIFAALSLGAIGLGATTSVAGAQPVGYPPHTASGSGSINIGQTITVSECGFAPNSQVAVDLNGTPYGTYTAGPTGCLNLTISARIGGVQLRINNGPWVEAHCGDNSIISQGTAPDGKPFTFTFTLTVGACTAAVVTPAKPGVVTPAAVTPPSHGLAFTGADIALTTLAGLALMAVGAALLILLRRRRASL